MKMSKRNFNHWQSMRKQNLEKTAELIQDYGGYAVVLNDMHDFLAFLAYELGCSLKTASEYIETVRGAAIFRAKEMKLNETQKILKESRI